MRLLLCSLLLALAVPVAATAAAASVSLDKVVVALKPDKNPEAMLAERKALADILAKRLGKPVEVIVPLSAAVIVEGLANGTIDLAYVSAMDMVNIRRAKAGSLLLAGKNRGATSYPSYWVTLKDDPAPDIAALKGQPVAFASKSSTSGFLIPLVDLHRRGLVGTDGDPQAFFGPGNVWYGTGYVSAVERVLSGEARAAAVSYYVLDEAKHLTAEQRSRLRKLQDQGPVPGHVLAVSGRLSAADRATCKVALLGLADRETGLDPGVFSAELTEVDETTHLAPVEQALTLIGRQP